MEAIRYRLRRNAKWRKTLDDNHIVFLPGRSEPLRVSENVAYLLPLLKDGADRASIAAKLSEFHCREITKSQSATLLAVLFQNQMLETGESLRDTRTFWLLDVGGLVQNLGLPRVRHAISLLLAIALAAAVYAIVQAARLGVLVNPFALIFDLNWLPFLLLLLVLVPLHELGHVLAGLASSTSLGRIGIHKRGLPVLRPFVEAILPKDDSRPLGAAVTAAGGPMADVINAGWAAYLAVHGPEWLRITAGGVCVLALIMAYQNLGIARRKDGYTILRNIARWLNLHEVERTGLPLQQRSYKVVRLLHLFLLLAVLALLLAQSAYVFFFA